MTKVDFLKNRPIAHRGLFNKEEKIPENSIIAFKRAIEKDYPIELDVHLLKDGKLVVFHDDNLLRMTGVNRKIKECNFNEIKELKLDNTGYKIPLFKDVLELVSGKVPLLIEIKSDRKVGETEKVLLESLKDYKGEFAIQSFNPISLKWLKDNFPKVPRGQLASRFKNDKMCLLRKLFLKNMFLNFITKPDFISYSINDFPNKKLEKFKKNGGLILGWTVKKVSDLEKNIEFFCNIIFENEAVSQLYQGKHDTGKS